MFARNRDLFARRQQVDECVYHQTSEGVTPVLVPAQAFDSECALAPGFVEIVDHIGARFRLETQKFLANIDNRQVSPLRIRTAQKPI